MRGLVYAVTAMVVAATATPSAEQEPVLLHAAGSLSRALNEVNMALRAADRPYLLREGDRIAEGSVGDILTRENLEALYRAPVRVLTDAKDGTSAFLPG